MSNNRVLHYVQDYLRITTTWVYGQITNNKKYEHIVVAKKLENVDKFPLKKLYSISELSSIKKLYNKVFFRIFGFYPLFLNTAKKQKVSILHAHFGHVGFKALKIKRKLNIPMVTFFYGYEMSALAKKEKYKNRFIKLFEEGEKFLVIGTCMKEELKKLGCPEEKIIVFHLGVDVEKYPFKIRKAEEGETIKFLFAANFTEKKGLEYAVEAFHLLTQKHKNVKFRIIGDGDEKEKVLSIVKKHNMEKFVEFAGFVPYTKLIEEMLSSHIFVQPSVTAKNGNTEGGYPISLLDAQSTGMPVLTTHHADNIESVVDGKSAFLSNERDINGLYENMLKLVEHQELWEEMGRIGRKHVEDNYNMKKQGEILGEIYDLMIEDYKTGKK